MRKSTPSVLVLLSIVFFMVSGNACKRKRQAEPAHATEQAASDKTVQDQVTLFLSEDSINKVVVSDANEDSAPIDPNTPMTYVNIIIPVSKLSDVPVELLPYLTDSEYGDTLFISGQVPTDVYEKSMATTPFTDEELGIDPNMSDKDLDAAIAQLEADEAAENGTKALNLQGGGVAGVADELVGGATGGAVTKASATNSEWFMKFMQNKKLVMPSLPSVRREASSNDPVVKTEEQPVVKVDSEPVSLGIGPVNNARRVSRSEQKKALLEMKEKRQKKTPSKSSGGDKNPALAKGVTKERVRVSKGKKEVEIKAGVEVVVAAEVLNRAKQLKLVVGETQSTSNTFQKGIDDLDKFLSADVLKTGPKTKEMENFKRAHEAYMPSMREMSKLENAFTQKGTAATADDFLDMAAKAARYMDPVAQERVAKALNELHSTEKGREWLAGLTDTTDPNSISSIYILPIQRAPRYEMLGREIVKYTDEKSPSYVGRSSKVQEIVDSMVAINQAKAYSDLNALASKSYISKASEDYVRSRKKGEITSINQKRLMLELETLANSFKDKKGKVSPESESSYRSSITVLLGERVRYANSFREEKNFQTLQIEANAEIRKEIDRFDALTKDKQLDDPYRNGLLSLIVKE